MDATSVVALAGLATTALTALGVPFTQGRVSARAAAAGRLHEQRITAYIDAASWLQRVQSSLNWTVDDPVFRSNGDEPMAEVPHEDLITARLRLIASPSLLRDWLVLVEAWDAAVWRSIEDAGRTGPRLASDSPETVRVQQAIDAVDRGLRRAMGATR